MGKKGSKRPGGERGIFKRPLGDEEATPKHRHVATTPIHCGRAPSSKTVYGPRREHLMGQPDFNAEDWGFSLTQYRRNCPTYFLTTRASRRGGTKRLFAKRRPVPQPFSEAGAAEACANPSSFGRRGAKGSLALGISRSNCGGSLLPPPASFSGGRPQAQPPAESQGGRFVGRIGPRSNPTTSPAG